MATIALLGTGLLGAGMVENLLTRGHTVRIWNRSPAKLEPLVAKGAVAARDPADAVRGAERVHLVLAEDAAVDAVIPQLRPGLGSKVPVIDHSTNLPKKVAARTAALHKDGVRYVSAPVFMSPTNAREASGMMALACSAADHRELEPALAAMTGKLWYVGERADLAAIYKLAGNSFYFAMTGALSDVFAIGRGNDADPATMMKLFEVMKAGAVVPIVGERLQQANGGPVGFELTMARKDARLMQECAGGASLVLLPAIAKAMDEALQKGRGSEDFVVYLDR